MRGNISGEEMDVSNGGGGGKKYHHRSQEQMNNMGGITGYHRVDDQREKNVKR